jgi:hypothetical protein
MVEKKNTTKVTTKKAKKDDNNIKTKIPKANTVGIKIDKVIDDLTKDDEKIPLITIENNDMFFDIKVNKSGQPCPEYVINASKNFELPIEDIVNLYEKELKAHYDDLHTTEQSRPRIKKRSSIKKIKKSSTKKIKKKSSIKKTKSKIKSTKKKINKKN